ncbi:CmpA/NrtA family ABC transporter substrate-binding protein [Devosia sp.]|uniref:CmpA/NrtA family ABC transporter substrate-binding protein n=1 Tax=Devosia sp. TaxID=1871048 RepID=UPI003BAA7B82
MAPTHEITAGFLPLLDSMLLIIARERGFAEAEGIALTLTRETSWANIRDRVAVGHFDVAHMLAPMPIASALGLTPIATAVIAPMALGLGGNAVTVSMPLWERLAEYGASADFDARSTGAALAKVVAAGGKKLTFGVVHPYSGHNYELRYWLRGSGIDPDQDVEIVVLPPALLPDALSAGAIDGYCVGEPWSSVGVETGKARIATVKAAIWRSSPEKVLGASERWAAHNAEPLSALLRALYRASEWSENPENHWDAATILARPAYLGLPATLLERGLSGRLAAGGGTELLVEDFFIPHARAATFPWSSHALWFYTQMVRWGHVEHSADNADRAAASYRPDLYRAAIAPLGVAVPSANAKVEGALLRPTPVGVMRGTLSLGPDGFFDEQVFDPLLIDAYIAAQRSA